MLALVRWRRGEQVADLHKDLKYPFARLQGDRIADRDLCDRFIPGKRRQIRFGVFSVLSRVYCFLDKLQIAPRVKLNGFL